MTSTANDALPPPFEPTNVVDLVSVTDSKITNVSLYSGRAEITRLYRFPIRTGQNQVNINGLPNVMDQESLRVEGRGAATIHDVTLSMLPKAEVPSTSARLEELLAEKELAEKGLARCKKGLGSLEGYLATMKVEHTDVADLDRVIENYDQTAEKLDKKVIALEKTIKKIDEDIRKEQNELADPSRDDTLGLKAAISVFAAIEGEVEIALIYAVDGAKWKALYDIRVDMQTKEKPVTLIYKAAIIQSTGEAWNDVPLSLETASPTFGVGLPTLSPWNLSVYRPEMRKAKSRGASVGYSLAAKPAPRAQSFSMAHTLVEVQDSTNDLDLMGMSEPLGHRSLAVASKGGVNATFRVPGTITIPSDAAAHNVTVVQLDLDAIMSWVAIPKIDAKTHLKAKIKNASEYTLLPGWASVYVDGSFISKSNVPLVSPQESFDCPLGLDPSVRVVYHPRSKKISQSGFYSRNYNHVFSQRITIHNTKSTPLSDFKVIDQVPVSENSQITVKLLSPGLTLPDAATASANEVGERGPPPPPPVNVSEGVVAQWVGADEQGLDLDALGKDGKFDWVCSVPSQGKINLLLSWEVIAPVRTAIVGL